MDSIQSMIDAVKGKPQSKEQRVTQTIDLAAEIVRLVNQNKNHEEAWLGRLMDDPQGRAFITAMTDRCFRSTKARRVASQIIFLLEKFGIPRFLNTFEKIEFLLFRLLGKPFAFLLIPMMRHEIQKRLNTVILSDEPSLQVAYFQECTRKNIRLNLNHLGEAILGEEEAQNRLATYLLDLTDPSIEYISVKVSTLYSQINLIGYAETLDILAERLRTLYRAAQAHFFLRADGTRVKKFVNLDMEEFHDFDLTLSLFKKVLQEEEFLSLEAGIVLQSYLPQAFSTLQDLTTWTQKRVKQGGAPIKIRLVKGANLSMERVESSLRGWPLATFDEKIETDANYIKMLEYACQLEHAEVVHMGVASHNLFDIALALLLRAEYQSENYVTFEMLKGMAEPLQHAIQLITGSLLLYCPIVSRANFHNAVAYLIRRLDENAGEENFLRHFYNMTPHNVYFTQQANLFTQSYQLVNRLPSSYRRQQNRSAFLRQEKEPGDFVNEPDTDFSLFENRAWARAIFTEGPVQVTIPLVIGGKESSGKVAQGYDPSQPNSPSFFYHLAHVEQIEQAIEAGKQFCPKWAEMSFSARFELLGRAAIQFKRNRKKLIHTMIQNGGKTIWEADPEVSEAVDFIEYYRRNWQQILSLKDVTRKPKGLVLVTPPWNFPCSIPVSGIAAALTAGNCVLFKPAPEAVLVGWQVAQTFWEAGIPKEALQFLLCADEPEGSYLIKHPEIASVILTGGTLTAQTFLKLRPGLDLHAEAGGKNSMIVTALSDRDLAVRDIIQSAFGHSGQKCSACSLLILEQEVYHEERFKKQLRDAAQSLVVGSAWNPHAKITPLIRVPEPHLMKALTTLEAGEEWLLQPRVGPNNPQLWSPGIKWGVRKGSFMHQTELFGPILGVMCASSLEEAIEHANGTPYGLTSGLYSLDEREHESWKKQIVAGNLYINRTITGAIVGRQPFGGCKASQFGPGAKAGGPNYVAQLALPTQNTMPEERGILPPCLDPLLHRLDTFQLTQQEQALWQASAESYAYWAPFLKSPHTLSLLGEDNAFYLVPLDRCDLRLETPLPTLLPLLQVIAASLICSTPLEISTPHPLPALENIPGLLIRIESQEPFLQRKPKRIRMLSAPSPSLLLEASQIGATFASTPPLANGRFELLHYLRELSISTLYHRYGYLSTS